MRHRRGIDLSQGETAGLLSVIALRLYAASTGQQITFANLADWFRLGVRCSVCGHVGWIDRHAMAHKFGRDRLILPFESHLHCL